jgi:predicted MFS family arabinose efflux permease
MCGFLTSRQVIGPVIGGFVGQDLDWRWTFWIILIVVSARVLELFHFHLMILLTSFSVQAGVVSCLTLAVMRETYEPTLLERKAARLHKKTGNRHLRPRTANTDITPGQLLIRAIVRPTKMLIFSPIVLLLSVYCAFMFGLVYLLFTTFPGVFEQAYGFGSGVSGLVYLGLGVGMILSIGLFGKLSDKLPHQPRGGTVARSELRLILMMWSSPLVPVGFFWYAGAPNPARIGSSRYSGPPSSA